MLANKPAGIGAPVTVGDLRAHQAKILDSRVFALVPEERRWYAASVVRCEYRSKRTKLEFEMSVNPRRLDDHPTCFVPVDNGLVCFARADAPAQCYIQCLD